MEDTIRTANFEGFRVRELIMTRNILESYLEYGVPEDFYDDGIQICFNRHSGYVFLTNEEHQVAMLNEETGRLESFYHTPYDGIEGTYIELLEQYDNLHEEDKEYVDEIKKEVPNVFSS